MTLLLLLSAARADYIMPPQATVLREATSIADVTVSRFDEDGHAHLVVNRVIRGAAPPAEITGVSLTCMGGSPELYGVEADTRYIMLLRDDQLYEETSYFEVKGDQCHAWAADSYARSWQPCDTVIARLQAL